MSRSRRSVTDGRSNHLLRLLPAVLLLFGAGRAGGQHMLPLDRIFGKPYLAGTRPSLSSISPDGKFLLVRWDSSAAGKSRSWLMHADGSGMHEIADTLLGEVAWGPDGSTIACTRKGDIFLTDTSFQSFERLTKTDAYENSLSWSKDGSRLFYSADRQLKAMATGHPAIFDIAQASPKDASVNLLDVTPDGRKVVFSESNREGLTEFLTPRYTGTDVTTSSFKGGVGKTRIGIAPVDTGKTVWIALPGDERFFAGDVAVSPDGRRIFIERFSANRKKREFFMASSDSGKAALIREETDRAWVEGGLATTRWMPDGKQLMTTSERDGWNHLYLMDTVGKSFRQITRGAWEVRWFDIAPDGLTAYILANTDDHAQWQLYAVDLARPGVRKLTAREGSYESPVMTKDGSAIVCGYSDFGKPTELVGVATADGSERALTHSVPEEFSRIRWTVPEIVHFTSRDGKSIPAMIYKPANFDPSVKHPVVVFVHGAGYLQNVYRGWTYYSREYMFHHRLTEKGYVVFEVEYRGSAGLGRDFRTDVYMHLGGKDLDDEVDGLEYLSGLGYIDTQRVGIYGGSYGGFMTLMGLFLTDKYACGAALRAVTSWGNYYRHNPWYTEARLGKPEENAEAYRVSSPITFADSLRKPLLILHGMVDDNVFFQDAVQLIAKLQKAGKKFEAMVYPVEGHGFNEPESWYDEYRRIEEFFDEHLQK